MDIVVFFISHISTALTVQFSVLVTDIGSCICTEK